MVNELKTGKDLVMEFGTSMYGEVFSLHDKNVSEIYKSTYNYFVKRSKGKVKKGLLVIGAIVTGKHFYQIGRAHV